MLPNYSCFGAIEEAHFLKRTRLLSSLEKKNSSFPRKEFRKERHRFLEDLLSTILSTAATRSPVWQRLSCFCPEIVIAGDEYSAFHLFGQLLDRLLSLAGLGGQTLNMQRLNSIVPSADSYSWKRFAKCLVCQSTASLRPPTSLGSVLGGICTKLVLWCLKIISMFSWVNTCVAFRSLSWQH